MKADKKHLDKIANCVGGLVPDRKVGGVSRKEALALGYGIAIGITVAAHPKLLLGVGDARAEAANLLSTAIDVFPDHRDEMLGKAEDEADWETLVATLGK